MQRREIVPIAHKTSASKILAIRPVQFPILGSGIAIFDEETHELEACSFLLASEHNELATKLRLFWDSHTGSLHEPTALYLKYAHHYPALYKLERRPIIFDNLCSLIEKSFKAKSLHRSIQKMNNSHPALFIRQPEIKKMLNAMLTNLPQQFARFIIETVTMVFFALENRTSTSSSQSLADDLCGTRVFQRFTAEPFDGPGMTFFPAETLSSSSINSKSCI
jgi:hypothetical protein